MLSNNNLHNKGLYYAACKIYTYSMKLEQIIKENGGAARLAEKLGVTRQAVYAWFDGTLPREDTVKSLLALAGGKVEFPKFTISLK